MTPLPYINPADLPKLTPRETEVFELLGKCMLYKEVGAELGCALRTVKTHAQRICQKLGVGSYRQVIAFCAARNERAGGDCPSGLRDGARCEQVAVGVTYDQGRARG